MRWHRAAHAAPFCRSGIQFLVLVLSETVLVLDGAAMTELTFDHAKCDVQPPARTQAGNCGRWISPTAVAAVSDTRALRTL